MNVGASDREERTFEAVPTNARAARQFVAEILRQHRASTRVISDYELVVSELATNIIEHGNGSRLVICVDVADPEWWEVEVVGGTSTATDQVFQPDTWTVAGADQASGRGLGIVRHLMDHIASDRTDGLVSIRCRRRRTAAQ